MEIPTDFELDQWAKDARRLITCTGCYGSGEDKWNEGRACPSCQGAGRAAAEPHVIRLVEEVRRCRGLIDGMGD